MRTNIRNLKERTLGSAKNINKSPNSKMKNSYKDKIIILDYKMTTTNKAINRKMIELVQRIDKYLKSKMN